MDEWNEAASAKREEKKKKEAAAEEELKNKSKLLARERQLKEELDRLKMDRIHAETELNTVTSALQDLEKQRQKPGGTGKEGEGGTDQKRCFEDSRISSAISL